MADIVRDVAVLEVPPLGPPEEAARRVELQRQIAAAEQELAAITADIGAYEAREADVDAALAAEEARAVALEDELASLDVAHNEAVRKGADVRRREAGLRARYEEEVGYLRATGGELREGRVAFNAAIDEMQSYLAEALSERFADKIAAQKARARAEEDELGGF